MLSTCVCMPYKLFLSSFCTCPFHVAISQPRPVLSYLFRLRYELLSIVRFEGLGVSLYLLSPTPFCNPKGGADTFVSGLSRLKCVILNQLFMLALNNFSAEIFLNSAVFLFRFTDQKNKSFKKMSRTFMSCFT